MLVLAMVVASFWGVLQLAALGSWVRTVRVGTLWLALGAGLYGCGVLTVTVEYLWTNLYASMTSTPITDVTSMASFTVDPFVEEFVKVLPLVLLALVVRWRRQHGLTDYLLLGAASGAGFGLLEALMRYGSKAANAMSLPGGWVLPAGLPPPIVPSLRTSLTSWLPDAVGGGNWFVAGDSLTSINLHLIYSALAGLAVGLIVRGVLWQRVLGLLLFLFAVGDHAAYNYDHTFRVVDGRVGHALSAPFVAAHPYLWVWSVLALSLAVALDRLQLSRAGGFAPDLRLASEGQKAFSAMALMRHSLIRPPWTALGVTRFVMMRRAALYARESGSLGAGQELLDDVLAARDQLDAADSAASWPRRVRIARPRPLWPLVTWLVALMPSTLYYLVGSTPGLGWVQSWLAHQLSFILIFAAPSVAGLLLLTWQVVVLFRALRGSAQATSSEAVMGIGLRLFSALGSGFAGIAMLALWGLGASPAGTIAPYLHALDALQSLLLVAGVALVIAAFIFFPPSIGFAAAATEGGLLLIPTASISGAFAATAGLGATSIVLSQASGSSGSSSSGTGSSGGTGSGGGPDWVPDIPQRPPAPKPAVRNWKLRNIVDNLWKGTKGPDRIGDGTTMDAVRNEIRTGRPTQGKFHFIKAKNELEALEKWLDKYERTATREDNLWARRLIAELTKALEGK